MSSCGGLSLGAELELAVAPAEEVEGGVLDLLAHRLLERRPVDAPLLQQDARRAGRPPGTSSARCSACLSCAVLMAPALTSRSPSGSSCGDGVGVGDHPVAEEDLARLALATDGERAALGTHLHQLEDVGETELLQVALEKHRPPFVVAGLAEGPRRSRGPVTSIGNAAGRLEARYRPRTMGQPARPPAAPRGGGSGRPPPRPRRGHRPAPVRPAGTPAPRRCPPRRCRRWRRASRAPVAVASAATPPMPMAQRTPSPRTSRPVIGPPMGVLPRKTIDHSAMTRPRIASAAFSCSRAFVVLMNSTPAPPRRTSSAEPGVVAGDQRERDGDAAEGEGGADEQAARGPPPARHEQGAGERPDAHGRREDAVGPAATAEHAPGQQRKHHRVVVGQRADEGQHDQRDAQ